MSDEKGITLKYDSGDYYGMTLCIWDEEKGDSRAKFIDTLKIAVKEESFLQKNLNIGELLDFIDILSNNLNGDDLYNNVVKNYLYVNDLHNESAKINLYDSFNKAVYVNYDEYIDNETITLFGKLTPLFKSPDDFKEWFKDKMYSTNENLYVVLFNEKESIKSLIASKKEYIKNINNTISMYKNSIDKYMKDICKLKEEIKELEQRLKQDHNEVIK